MSYSIFPSLLTYHGIGVAAELPCLFIVEGSVTVTLLLLHDETHVLVGLHAGTVVLQDSLREQHKDSRLWFLKFSLYSSFYVLSLYS